MSTPPGAQNSSPQRTLYFAYGSNLSLYQMATRCPTSAYFGFGVLPSYRWIISGRGYANVVYSPQDVLVGESRSRDGDGDAEGTRDGNEVADESRDSDENPTSFAKGNENGDDDSEDTVEGLLYYLEPADEARLDIAEGVPHAYTKHILDITIPSPPTSASTSTPSASAPIAAPSAPAPTPTSTSTVRALVYVDLTRTSPGTCKEEYVARMNRGIRDAQSRGMSVRYVERVLRRWVRDEPVPGGGDAAVEDPFALRA